MGSEIARKNYYSLDLMKFMCAILILSTHFVSERANLPTIIDMPFSLYIIAVPFFFCCSGFLFFDKLNRLCTKIEKKNYFLQYIKRIFLMYAIWSLIYFVFVLTNWIRDGVTLKEILRYLHGAIVTSTYSTIWFLPALIVAIIMAYFLNKKFSIKIVFLISIPFYLFCAVFYTYDFLLIHFPILNKVYEIYTTIFLTSRNGILNGFPFVALGGVIASQLRNETKIRNHKELIYNIFFTIIFSIGFITEALLVKLKYNVFAVDTVILLVPFTYFLFHTLLCLQLKERKIYLILRKLSLLVFVSQRLFLSAFPSVLPDIIMNTICSNPYIGLIIIVSMTITFSLILMQLSKRYHFLKIL